MVSLNRLNLFALLTAVVILAASQPAEADETPRVRIGFDGSYKVGRWTPIEVDVPAGDTASCDVIVPDPDGNATTLPLTPAANSAEGVTRYEGVFRTGRLSAPVRVRVAGRTHLFAPSDAETNEPVIRPARQTVRFMGVLGADATIGEAAAIANRSGEDEDLGNERVRVISFDGWEELPVTDNGLDALDVLFISDRFPATGEQSDALRNWVRRGGHLVLSLGEHGDAFRASPLAVWVPAEIGETRTVEELAIVVDRVPGAQALPAAVDIPAASMETGDGRVLFETFEGPLAIRYAYGLGRVTVFALDYTAPPLGDWNGAPQLCLLLADLDVRADGRTAGPTEGLRSSGMSDLATQLVSNLDWFPAVAKPSYGSVLAVVLGFLIIIGPVDFFLVNRFFRRPRRTWITLPLVVAAAAGYGVVAARQNHPQQPLLNQFEIVDVDVSLSTVRVQNCATLFSPASQRQAVEFTVEPWMAAGDASPTRVSWLGKPETGFRGMYRSSGLDFGTAPYEFSPGSSSIRNLPIDQWSTKTLYADWERADSEVPVRSNLVDSGTGELTGSFSHQLPGPISDWILAYGGFVYFPGGDGAHAAIPPAVRFEPGEVLPVPRILQRFLVGHHHVFVAGRDQLGGDSSPSSRSYDPLNRDPLDLIRAITFYSAAGGEEYTGLTNSSFARDDLSAILPLHRAVLLGRIDGPATRSNIGEEAVVADSSTFVRIILPVEPASGVDSL